MAESSSYEAFARRLDRRGADLSRWPEADAAEARALLAASPEARGLLRRAERLDALVARAASAEPPNGLAFRVVGDVASRRAERPFWFTRSREKFGFASAGFCAAAVAVGIVIGAFAEPARTTVTPGLDLGAAFEVSLVDGDL